MPVRKLIAIAFAMLLTATATVGQIPALSSRQGAAYTLYLDFGGFSYTGTWSGSTPGTVAAYPGSTANMTEVWARTAEKYAAFNVNVTTVDPAIAANQAGSDSARQNYYAATPQLMHTIVTPDSAWFGAAGGVSFVGTWQNGYTSANSQYKTNWVFSNNLGNGFPKYVAEAAGHENGHAAGLSHQARYNLAGVQQDAYDDGRDTGGTSPNYFNSPTMGVGYYARRSSWRYGAIEGNNSNTAQNDVLRIQQNNNMPYAGSTGFYDDSIGKTAATATTLPVTGTTINSTAARGVITPLSSTAPNPIGASNYTKDYFKVVVSSGQTAGLNVSLKSGIFTNNSGSTENPGWTLDATLRLLASDGTTQLGISNTSDYLENITVNNLAAGTYYLEVSSAGGLTDPYGNKYYDMGGYILLGSFTPVPEPVAVFAVAVSVFAAGGLVRRYRRGGATAPPAVAA